MTVLLSTLHSVTSASVQVRSQAALPWQHTKQPFLHVSEQVDSPVQPTPHPVSHANLQFELPAQPPPQFSWQRMSHDDPPAQSRLQLPAWVQSTLQDDCPSQSALQPP